MPTANITKKSPVKEELLRVLTKGMITIPKTWRDDLDIKPGDRIKAFKKDYQIIIEPLQPAVPYRVYSQKELKQFLKEDKISPKLKKQIKSKFGV